MTELEIKGEYEGAGGKFKIISSFPKTTKVCETVNDKIKGRKFIKYIASHTDDDGKISVVETKIKRE